MFLFPRERGFPIDATALRSQSTVLVAELDPKSALVIACTSNRNDFND